MNATATALRPVCATPGCGAVLSTYRPRGETLCAACRRRASEDEQVAPRVDLERLVAGILLTSDALRPGEPVNVGLELAAYGVAGLLGFHNRPCASEGCIPAAHHAWTSRATAPCGVNGASLRRRVQQRRQMDLTQRDQEVD